VKLATGNCELVNDFTASSFTNTRTKSPISFGLFVRRVLTTEAAVLAELQPLGRLLLVLRRAVVAPLTVLARQRDVVSHGLYA
jgi:hypothetical protein